MMLTLPIAACGDDAASTDDSEPVELTTEPGAVRIPAGFQFLDARDNRLLGVRLDELDVPMVEVWEVLWP